MEYIKINKKIITDKVLELEEIITKYPLIDPLHNNEDQLKFLQSILKQSEEIK